MMYNRRNISYLSYSPIEIGENCMSKTSTGRISAPSSPTQPIADDRLLPITRGLAIFIIPFLVAASIILLIWPTKSGQLFAWPIQPPMTAMMLGSAYLGGVYFFTRVAIARRWHTVQAGFLPVTAFASLLGIATLLHWDRFTHMHISFWTWAVLYFATPFLVFGVWLWNRRFDPHVPDANDVLLPQSVRWLFSLAGALTLLIALLLFFLPDLMIAVWPWKLSPLTARVVGAMFALPGVLGLEFAFDPRWSAMQRILEAQALSIFLILISAARDWGNMKSDYIGSLLFVFGMGAFLLGIIVLYLVMQSRRQP
jgi:hypothetical protein